MNLLNCDMVKVHYLLFLFLFISGCNKYEYEIEKEDILSQNITIPAEPKMVKCENGYANQFPCKGLDFYSQISLQDLESDFANDNWGWTDPIDKKEYVIQGLNDGTAFINITDPVNPIFLGKLLTETNKSTWRDIKVFKNHAFIVSEANEHGLQVFDLTRLRDINEFQFFSADAVLKTFGNAHNIAINESSGFAYVIGSKRYSGGPIFIDINDPKNPTEIGGYSGMGYSHDAQVVIYDGPDKSFLNKEIYIGSNSDGGSNNRVVILDVTNKEQPILISRKSYSGSRYAHQSWLSSDHKYLFFGDELDEYYYGNNSKTYVFDLSELDRPVLHHTYTGTTNAIDHNGYVVGDFFYLSNYTAGLRVIDIKEISNKKMDEIMYFDTHVFNDDTTFNGVWNVYPFFQSGVIAISDSQEGLFLVKPSL